ncbi:unnamed protein product [Lampetra fluviatilis]
MSTRPPPVCLPQELLRSADSLLGKLAAGHKLAAAAAAARHGARGHCAAAATAIWPPNSAPDSLKVRLDISGGRLAALQASASQLR